MAYKDPDFEQCFCEVLLACRPSGGWSISTEITAQITLAGTVDKSHTPQKTIQREAANPQTNRIPLSGPEDVGEAIFQNLALEHPRWTSESLWGLLNKLRPLIARGCPVMKNRQDAFLDRAVQDQNKKHFDVGHDANHPFRFTLSSMHKGLESTINKHVDIAGLPQGPAF